MPSRSRAPRGLAACRFHSKGLLPPTWHCLPISPELESGNSCAQRYPWVEWGVLFAAASVQLIPVLVFVWLMQKHLVAGLTAGATKG